MLTATRLFDDVHSSWFTLDQTVTEDDCSSTNSLSISRPHWGMTSITVPSQKVIFTTYFTITWKSQTNQAIMKQPTKYLSQSPFMTFIWSCLTCRQNTYHDVNVISSLREPSQFSKSTSIFRMSFMAQQWTFPRLLQSRSNVRHCNTSCFSSPVAPNLIIRKWTVQIRWFNRNEQFWFTRQSFDDSTHKLKLTPLWRVNTRLSWWAQQSSTTHGPSWQNPHVD